jgi:glucan phosphoethanolaminetransferase (alkaline phosphatase superfamily)
MYKHLYGQEEVADQKRFKYLSLTGIIAPAVVALVSVWTKHWTLFIISMIVWLVCLFIVFFTAFKRQRKFVENLKKSGMPKKEFIRIMRSRTKNEAQVRKYVKLWDSIP